MKRFAGLFLILALLSGCSEAGLDRGLALRTSLQGHGCSFRATVSADYGDWIHTFVLDCVADETGEIQFSVAAPDSIGGISGKITGESGFLTFDDEILAFPLLADGQLSPISAPWIFVHSLRSGYLRSCTETGNGFRVTIDDSYAENAFQTEVLLNQEELPTGVEILWKGRRILTVIIENFTIS